MAVNGSPSFRKRGCLYSSSQLPPALGVFSRFLTQFLINLHEVLQALFATIPAPTQKFL